LLDSVSHLSVRQVAVVKWCMHVRLLKRLVLRIAMP